ncbi:Uncharacterised protein [Bordetella ansorpii]|uniref:Uncharacterized protein n=1 Tax=Bordetella ansorpii TaxID=288768 RepID=A0A157SFD2_9BORD|nr:Uncharacterised protein [Bordetella ansorpii]
MSLRFKGSDLRPVLTEAIAANAASSWSRTRACTSSPSRESAARMGV